LKVTFFMRNSLIMEKLIQSFGLKITVEKIYINFGFFFNFQHHIL
jgi:hypothetical protein